MPLRPETRVIAATASETVARMLVLQRDEPVAITIVNESHEPAAVHWHGIELESFPDGVAGWSGEGMSPIVAHPDVRRSLMTMRALTAASRAICTVAFSM